TLADAERPPPAGSSFSRARASREGCGAQLLDQTRQSFDTCLEETLPLFTRGEVGGAEHAGGAELVRSPAGCNRSRRHQVEALGREERRRDLAPDQILPNRLRTEVEHEEVSNSHAWAMPPGGDSSTSAAVS